MAEGALAAEARELREAQHLYVLLEAQSHKVAPLTLGTTNVAFRDAAIAAFNGLSTLAKMDLGDTIRKFRLDNKATNDLSAHVIYAQRFRGAPGDDDDVLKHDGAHWRPTVQYFIRRKKEYLAAGREAEGAATSLVQALQDYDLDKERTVNFLQHCIEYWNAKNTQGQASIDRDLPLLENSARLRIADMEKARAEMLAEEKKEKEKRAGEEAMAEEEEEEDADQDVVMGDVGDVEMQDAPAVLDVTWHGQVHLGAGSYGTADLWVGTHPDMSICHRVVRKNCDLRPIWSIDSFWTDGAPGNTGSTAGTGPTEIQALADLANKPGSDAIVALHNWRLRLGAQRADLYLEYCPYGDAFDAVLHGDYYSRRHGDRKIFPWVDYSRAGDISLVPEPFIWSTFLSLVMAGLLMERGSLEKNPDDPQQQHWPVIVHRDLKLDNIFMGVPATDRFRMYPQAKIADFGLSLMVPPNDPRPIHSLFCHGSPEHAPPEQHVALTDRHTGALVRQSTQSNVWGIGIILHSMLAGENGPVANNDTWFDWTNPSRREPPEFDQTARGFYSAELRNLVLACLRFDAEDRPTLDYLFAEVTRYTTPATGGGGDGGDDEDKAKGMRDLKKEDDEQRYADLLTRYRMQCGNNLDKYAVGLALPLTSFMADRTPVATVPAPLMQIAARMGGQ